MARIGVRKDSGKLFFDFQWKGKRRREQTTLEDTPQNRKRAEQVLRALLVDMDRGEFSYRKFFPSSPAAAEGDVSAATTKVVDKAEPASVQSPTFASFVATWQVENEVRWRRTTRELMRMIVDRHLLPAFGDKPIASITRADVLGFRAEFAKRDGKRKGTLVSPKTVNDTMGVLKSILDEAAARFTFASPCQNIKRLKPAKVDVQPFTLGEVQRLIAACRADYRDYVTVRAFTGLRTGEANGLRWSCVDFERREILVRETFTHGERDDTKTDASRREVKMSPPVYEALRRLRAQAPDATGYVFCSVAGEPIDNANFCNRVWYPLLRHLGLARRRPYQLRHTAATLWLLAGENPLWIARQLGHANTEMLFRVYARWVKDITRNDGSAFERLLESTPLKSENCKEVNHEVA